jgi:DMSO reductase family type II enzyme heme b subunit
LTLKDDTGRPSIATDLTKRWRYKRGGTAQEVYRILTTGMNGTPMQSFASSLSGDERWAIAHYLERTTKQRPRFSPTVQALEIPDAIPSDPNAELWRRIPPTAVPLGPQVEVPPYWTQPAIDLVELTVVTKDQQLGILVVWTDPTNNVTAEDTRPTAVDAALARHGSWRLPDRIALQLPEKVDPKGARPPLYLGATDDPVVRWTWSADRHEKGDHTAVIERIAGPLAPPVAVTDAALVQTVATYEDGQRRLLLLTKRPPKTQTTMAVAVHAWDGAHGEAGAWHGLSSWLTVNLR